jgi:glutamyl/glutaminyl-tRNA synthetase
MVNPYIGRFAPSPTGPLHAGSLVAALASWLDARAHGGKWLVRIEDVDTPRCVPGAAETILQQLHDCGLVPDEEPAWQSTRGSAYQQALDRLVAMGRAYPCACSRKDVELALAALGPRTSAMPNSCTRAPAAAAFTAASRAHGDSASHRASCSGATAVSANSRRTWKGTSATSC